MYASSPNGHHTRGRSSRRSQSDPGQSYVTPPYTVQWPAPARQTTGEPNASQVASFSRPPSRSSSIEPTPGDPFMPQPGSLLAQQLSGSPGETSASTSASPRSPSPQRSGHYRSSSRQGSIRAPQGSGPLIRDVPQPPRSAFSASTAVTAPHLYQAGQPGHGLGAHSQVQPQSGAMQRQGSHHSVHQQSPASVYQNANPAHLASVQGYPSPITTHHVVHHRSRSRPPSAASHRYASSITPPVYGHGSSGTLNASRTSLNGGVSPHRNHHATSPPPGISTAHHPGSESAHVSSGPPRRSRSHTRAHPSAGQGIAGRTVPVYQTRASPPGSPPPALAARGLRRTAHRPALPANYDGQTQTRYVSMLLAMDDISPFFNILASFFTWILLAGFVLLPGTFASWKDEPSGTPQSVILGVVNHLSLFVIGWICTGIGACGMIWLWWRWNKNYVWITNRIFVPGFLNSAAGVISTLSSVYGSQGGVFGETEESTIIATSALTLICGMLMLVYEFWFIRNLRLEHDQMMGVEMAGKHGEGILGEKR